MTNKEILEKLEGLGVEIPSGYAKKEDLEKLREEAEAYKNEKEGGEKGIKADEGPHSEQGEEPEEEEEGETEPVEEGKKSGIVVPTKEETDVILEKMGLKPVNGTVRGKVDNYRAVGRPESKAIDIHKKDGKYVRTYSFELHGEGYKELAVKFLKTNYQRHTK